MKVKKARFWLIIFLSIIVVGGIGLIVNYRFFNSHEVVSLVNNNTDQSESKLITGYIVLEDNLLRIDEVEIVTTEEEDRIKELNLDEDIDMPDGYYIYNKNKKKQTFEITNRTAYTFVDFDLLFVKEDEGDRLYTTTKQEEFLKHLNNTYADRPPAQRVPFFVEVKDGKVISITEKFEYTI